jgi:hypothetical protein
MINLITFVKSIFVKKKKRVDVKYKISLDDFERFVYEWNNTNPIDRYYREKYGIRFNSPDHRVLNFIDMAFEYYEDCIYSISKKEYTPGDYLKEQPIILPSNEDLIKQFESNY